MQLGYCYGVRTSKGDRLHLSYDTRHQVMFICLGDGANGKSTLLEVLRQIL